MHLRGYCSKSLHIDRHAPRDVDLHAVVGRLCSGRAVRHIRQQAAALQHGDLAAVDHGRFGPC